MSTITTPSAIDYANDCNEIYHALKGICSDKNKIIEILGHRNSSQRSSICDIYKEKYKIDLLDQIRSKFRGNLERAMLSWMQDPGQREAIILHNSIKGGTSDNIVLIVLMCIKTISPLRGIVEAYYRTFGCHLEKDLAELIPGHLPIILQILEHLRSYMPVEMPTNMHYVRADLEKSIKGQVSAKDIMIRIRVMYPTNHFAEVLYKSMKGIVKDDQILIHVIVARAEIDMKEIKREF